MVVAQKVKEAEITEQDSLLLTRNLLRIAIFNISYIRGLFPEKYFTDKSVPALEMKIKKLMPLDAESRRLIDWMEKGVYDALQQKYLKTLLFCICKELEGPMIEEYAFSFSYSNSNSEEVSMNVNRIGNKKNGATFKSNPMDVTPDQMRSSACKMVRTLVQLMRTLDQMPGKRTILMKLLYYDDVTERLRGFQMTGQFQFLEGAPNCTNLTNTKNCSINNMSSLDGTGTNFIAQATIPADYEPPFFRCCSENEAPSTWTKNPLKMEIGNVNSKHFVLNLKVKSVLDPCEDENDGVAEDEVSLGGDSVQDDDSSSDSEVRPSLADQFVVAPIAEKRSTDYNGMNSDADTQDAEHDEVQIARVKEWIASRHISTVNLDDILSNFRDMSVALTEDIMERLAKEGLLSKVGKDSYSINKEKGCGMKQEVEMKDVAPAEKMNKSSDEDYIYMKALYHALPMDYVTITKLQNKLDGEANQNTVRKLVDKMAHDGYLKNSGNKRLGKRVVHSELTNQKLLEVKKTIEGEPMETETKGQQPFDFIPADFPPTEHNVDGSTCGGLHSIGSDTTRTRGRSEAYQTGSIQAREQGNTPTSKTDLIPSLESGVGKGARGRASVGGDGSHSAQDKRSLKSSMVKEPILQHVKRQKCQA